MRLESPVPAARVKSYPSGAAVVALLAALLAASGAHAAGLTVRGLSGSATVLDPATIEKMPALHQQISLHGAPAAFDGPSLWSVLGATGVLRDAGPRVLVHAAVRISGADGYVALVAIGEISPEFEANQVILADRQDGKALPPGHWRVVVPGDRHGGRSVRDVVSIAVVAP
jgi:hypothetical protein